MFQSTWRFQTSEVFKDFRSLCDEACEHCNRKRGMVKPVRQMPEKSERIGSESWLISIGDERAPDYNAILALSRPEGVCGHHCNFTGPADIHAPLRRTSHVICSCHSGTIRCAARRS